MIAGVHWVTSRAGVIPPERARATIERVLRFDPFAIDLLKMEIEVSFRMADEKRSNEAIALLRKLIGKEPGVREPLPRG